MDLGSSTQCKLFVVESPKQSKPLHDPTIENSGNVENLILYTFDCLHCKMGAPKNKAGFELYSHSVR